MNSKNLYIAAGVLAVVGVGAFAFLTLTQQPSGRTRAATEPKSLESVERREERAALHGQPRRIAKKKASESGTPVAAAAVQGEEIMVMTDVTDINASEWVQSMYDTAFVYQGKGLTKAELEEREKKRIGVHTEDSIREQEDSMAAALPDMRAEIETARQEREAEQKRFKGTGETPEQKAARDGVHLEH